MGEHDRQVGEVDGDVVDEHRVRVLQPDAGPATHAGPDARMTGVEEGGHPVAFEHLVQRVGRRIVRVEALGVRVELEALHPVLGDQPFGHPHRRLAPSRIHAGEGDGHIGVQRSLLGDLLVRRYRVMAVAHVGVDDEDDERHPALAVVGGHLGHRERGSVGTEVVGHRLQVLADVRGAVHRPMGVRVHVDGVDGVEVDRYGRVHRWRLPTARHSIVMRSSELSGPLMELPHPGPLRDGSRRSLNTELCRT